MKGLEWICVVSHLWTSGSCFSFKAHFENHIIYLIIISLHSIFFTKSFWLWLIMKCLTMCHHLSNTTEDKNNSEELSYSYVLNNCLISSGVDISFLNVIPLTQILKLIVWNIFFSVDWLLISERRKYFRIIFSKLFFTACQIFDMYDAVRFTKIGFQFWQLQKLQKAAASFDYILLLIIIAIIILMSVNYH